MIIMKMFHMTQKSFLQVYPFKRLLLRSLQNLRQKRASTILQKINFQKTVKKIYEGTRFFFKQQAN